MNISGIRPSVGFYDYNSIMTRPTGEAESLVTPEVKTQPEEVAPKSNDEGKERDFAEARGKQTFGAYDYANQYDPSETFSLKGENSDIRSLDVEKALSDMRKDQLLQQYQYFVGQQAPVSSTDAASSTRKLEDFTL